MTEVNVGDAQAWAENVLFATVPEGPSLILAEWLEDMGLTVRTAMSAVFRPLRASDVLGLREQNAEAAFVAHRALEAG